MVVLSAVLAPAAFAQEVESATDYEVFESIEKVDNGDGLTWSKPDTGRTVGEVELVGTVLWQYDGMAEYAYVADPYGEELVEPSDEEPTTREDRFLGAMKVTGNGERWLAIDVEFGDAPDYSDLLEEARKNDVAGEYGTWKPNSGWDHATCPDGKKNDDAVTFYDGDQQSAFSSSSADRQRRVVWLRVTFDGSTVAGCSGIQTDTTEVLTAAHCIQDHAGTMGTILSVCSRGNTYTDADCMLSSPPGGYDILTNYGWWSGSKNEAVNTKNDYALVQWTNGSTDSTQLTGMAASGFALSEMSDTEVEEQHVARYGYDHYHYPGSCDDQRDNTPYDSLVTYGWKLSYEWDNTTDGSMHWIDNDQIKTRIDSGDGGSGGPYFVCPDNSSTCANGEQLVGLLSGHYQPFLGTWYSGGPWHAQFADFVNLN